MVAFPKFVAWLRRHRTTAITRLIPDAVGKKGAARDAAEHGLRWLAVNTADGRAAIEAIGADYAASEPKVTEALAQVLRRLHVTGRRASLPALRDLALAGRTRFVVLP